MWCDSPILMFNLSFMNSLIHPLNYPPSPCLLTHSLPYLQHTHTLPPPTPSPLPLTQTQREREHAPEIHRAFQRDLCKMRLEASRAYVKTLTDGQMVCTHIRLFEGVCICECTFSLHCTHTYIKTRVKRSYVRRATRMNRLEKSSAK